MEIIQTDTLIIGGGAAGLNAALNLNKSKVTLVEKGGSNSVISPWNLMIKPEEEIREKIIKNGHQMSDPKIKVQVPDEIRELGDLGISKEIKNKVWRSLGPIKRKDELEELKKLLSSKTNLTSQERLLSKIVEICLLRKESVGLFYREDLPTAETAEPSFLIDGNIYFGNEEQR
ncbi:MAG: FAD-binding protein [Candidatus Paceibacterota bacterium]